MPPSRPPVTSASLSGWGRYPVVDSRVARPETQAELDALVGQAASLIPRGAGRSYGDAALSRDGLTVVTTRLDRLLAFDDETGVLRAEAGVRLADLLDVFVPRGWFLPVTPGTKAITLGGAVAFDVHGKNHHCDGGFSNFVRSLRLLTASGDGVRCSRDTRPDLFWATLGGAGLTGVVTDVTLQLRPIETAYVVTRRVKAPDLDATFDAFSAHEPNHQYAVAWIDCLSDGDAVGRSLCTFGDHARLPDLDADRRAAPFARTSGRLFDVPVDAPRGLLRPWTVRAFNHLYYAQQRSEVVRRIEPLDPFFYPLDVIGDWNRLYGPDGFVQYQCVLPMDESYDGLVELLARIRASGHASFLAVLKRMGAEDAPFLSFPMRGYTLALDLPRREGLTDLLRDLDAIVVRRGGRVYLAKDATLSPDAFRATYPHVDDWLAVKRRVDPTHRFRSALSTRLHLSP